MVTRNSNNGRSHIGYGSSYHRGDGSPAGIRAVLGGQNWTVTPDREAPVKSPCVWMASGVVRFKPCHHFHDCNTCKYDQGMLRQADQGKVLRWQEAMRKRPDLERACRHSLTRRISHRVCAYDYQCAHCDFDQYFEEVLCAKRGAIATDVRQVRGFDVPMDFYFHQGHTWARIESGGSIRIGLDDFALKVLGKADALDLPPMGKELEQGAVGWGIKRAHHHADVRSPISGVIMEVNALVRERPGIANEDPYGHGWLFLVHHPQMKKAVKPLKSEDVSLDWITSEVNNLEQMIETVTGPLAADGGVLQPDIYGSLPALGWENLVRSFLKT